MTNKDIRMQMLPHNRLLNVEPAYRSHTFASEPHLRVEVMRFTKENFMQNFYTMYHGELILLCLKGKVNVSTSRASVELIEGDQLMLTEGAEFKVHHIETRESESMVEFIWGPGPNPCEICYETNKRFYGSKD